MKIVNVCTTLWVRASGFEWHIPHKVVQTLTIYVQKRPCLRMSTDCSSPSKKPHMQDLYTYMYIYIHILTYSCMHIFIYIYKCIFIHMFIYLYIHICMYIRVSKVHIHTLYIIFSRSTFHFEWSYFQSIQKASSTR
jgi:hypothetical protein